MTLLQKALAVSVPDGGPANSKEPKGLREECELALAYRRNEVFSGQVKEVMGLKTTALVSAWESSAIMRGIRNGILEVKMKEKT